MKEKELTRARDALAAERRRMPWTAVEKDYRFEGPDGSVEPARPVRRPPPADRLPVLLRAGRRRSLPEQRLRRLLVRAPTRSSNLAHLNARDTTLVFVSRAPQAEISSATRSAWAGSTSPGTRSPTTSTSTTASTSGTGTNAFIREGDDVFRTYFIDSRGDEAMGTTWSYLDITALGRQEEWEDSPEGYPQTAAVPVVAPARRVSGGVIPSRTSAACRSRRCCPSPAGRAAACLMARAWIALRLRRRREP